MARGGSPRERSATKTAIRALNLLTHPMSEAKPPINPLFGSRYSAAWIEHGTRITQRQNVLQNYLFAWVGIVGFYVHGHQTGGGDASLSIIIIVAACASTVLSSCLIAMHNVVIEWLVDFMCECERQAKDEISIPYFSDESGNLARHHGLQRSAHRRVYFGYFCVTNGVLCYLVSKDAPLSLQFYYWIVLAFLLYVSWALLIRSWEKLFGYKPVNR